MANPPSDTNVEGIFNIKDQSAYLGGYVATGIMAIVQTAFPLLIYQLWGKKLATGDNLNMWFQYANQAMQAGGVVAWGLPALAFLGSFIFELNIMERLGYILLWVVHGGLLGMLSDITVVSYLVVALVNYKDSTHVTMACIGIVLAIFFVMQVGWEILLKYFAGDTIMYMIAGELKMICEKYGELCSEYGILDKNDQGDNFQEVATELNTWVW